MDECSRISLKYVSFYALLYNGQGTRHLGAFGSGCWLRLDAICVIGDIRPRTRCGANLMKPRAFNRLAILVRPLWNLVSQQLRLHLTIGHSSPMAR